jgi:competence protein ComEA
VGPRTAERILAFRREQGPFRRAEELMNVKGIGEKAFRRMRRHILVDGVPASADPAGAEAADAAGAPGGAGAADPDPDARGSCGGGRSLRRRTRRPAP